MSFVLVGPEALAAAVSDLTSLGSAISAVHAGAAAPTTSLLAAGTDEVSVAVAALFGTHGKAYQALSAQAAAFHQEFVQALAAGARSYAVAEAAASPLESVLDGANAPVLAITGRSLIGNGAAGGGKGPIYQAIQQANEKLLIGFTNVVGRLEQPLVPYIEQITGPRVPPPVPLPAPINGTVSLILSGTLQNVWPQHTLDLIAQEYNLPGRYGAVWQPGQLFPPHLIWAT
jgi:hypothetical protein